MLKIYNTLTRQLEEFKPIEDKKVRFYHCGPTVYWTQHIGNLRGMTMADLIRRSLEYLGYEVNFVRNYTDVGHLTGDNLGDADIGEDKMEKGARREGLTPDQVADKYIKIFEADTQALNIKEPDVKPRATQYIKQMKEMVKVLINKGYAYISPKAVYFDVSKFKNYNQLNKQKMDFNKAGAGVGDAQDPNKKHSADFVLWFFKTGTHKNALQTWESTFKSEEVENGRGFPGWHIECSAMSKALLGETIDIHMGGVEHISVHHTNEIAQSEAVNGVKFVNYWLHNEHLIVNGKKMAKSEGTGYSLQEVTDKGFNPLDLRYFFLNSHYRSKQNFTWEALDSAHQARGKIIDKMKEYSKYRKGDVDKNFQKRFIETLENDFNIPQALVVMWDLIRSDENKADKYATILDFDRVFGLNLNELKAPSQEMPAKVQRLVEQREQARGEKDWVRSDKLRQKIQKLGWQVEDAKAGTKVYRKR